MDESAEREKMVGVLVDDGGRRRQCGGCREWMIWSQDELRWDVARRLIEVSSVMVAAKKALSDDMAPQNVRSKSIL